MPSGDAQLETHKLMARQGNSLKRIFKGRFGSSLPHHLLQLFHRHHGGLAGEVLADVGGGVAADGFHAGDGFVVRGEPCLACGTIRVEEGGVGEGLAVEVIGVGFGVGRRGMAGGRRPWLRVRRDRQALRQDRGFVPPRNVLARQGCRTGAGRL